MVRPRHTAYSQTKAVVRLIQSFWHQIELFALRRALCGTTMGTISRSFSNKLFLLIKMKAPGGEGGIRTLDTLASMPHFECGAFNHSATSPYRSRCRGRLACSPTFRCDQGLSPAYSGGRTAGADHPPPAGGRAASGAWDTDFRLQAQNYVPAPAYVRDRRDDRSLSFSISCVSM